jgi:hypothetical protein
MCGALRYDFIALHACFLRLTGHQGSDKNRESPFLPAPSFLR